MILRFFAFANRIDHYGGNLKRFLNDYMGKYAPKEEAQVSELGATFRQTMQNVYTVFATHAGRLYTVDVVQELLSNSATLGMANEPLFEAKALFRAGYFPAAGAVTGVVLERHLKQLCTNQTPSVIARGETINPLNDALKSAQVYDQTQHRRIQVMGDIRNRCSHSVSNPPSKEEVWELIEDVDSFIRSYPI